MARFCTKCGLAAAGPEAFCTKCGGKLPPLTPEAGAPASGVSPTPPASVSPPTPPASVAPPAPPARQSSSPLKIFLIIFAVFAGISVLGIGSCLYIGYRVKQKVEEVVKIDQAGEPGQSVTIKTPEGEIRLGDRRDKQATEPIGGVPPYPGSRPLEGGAELSFGGLGVLAGQEYETPDSAEKVVAFYKERFGSGLTIVESDGHFQLALTDSGREGVTTISIEREEDQNRTKIMISHIGK